MRTSTNGTKECFSDTSRFLPASPPLETFNSGSALKHVMLPSASVPARPETQVMRRISHPIELTSIQWGGNTPIRLLQTTRFNLRQPFPTYQERLPAWCSEGSRTSKETLLVYSIRTANKAELLASSPQASEKENLVKMIAVFKSDVFNWCHAF